MKKLILSGIFFCFAINATAQKLVPSTNYYALQQNKQDTTPNTGCQFIKANCFDDLNRKNKKTKKVTKVKFDNDSIYVYYYDFNQCKTLICQGPARPDYHFTTNYLDDNFSATTMTIPFKIRFKKDTLLSTTEVDIATGGFFLGKTVKITRYFYDKTSVTEWSLGAFFAPSAIELSLENTGKKVEGITQPALSSGIALAFTIKKISLFAACGIDTGLSKTIRTKWVYNNDLWIGFGIGIKPEFLQF